MNSITIPERVRVSYGSAILLGLIRGVSAVDPTTVYLLTYYAGKCTANCAFCPQSRESTARSDRLSRVIWPDFRTTEVIEKLANSQAGGRVKRVCIQTLNYKNMFEDVLGIVGFVSERSKVPISVSTKPLTLIQLKQLKMYGVDRISIPLDCATRNVFRVIKGSGIDGPYSWGMHWKGLTDALKVFGLGGVSTHIIVGLGETDEELAEIFRRLIDLGIFPGLFAFTPVQGTNLEESIKPSISRYRRIQLLHYLLTNRSIRYEDLKFGEKGEVIDFGLSRQELGKIIRSGLPFVTSGCPDCNRPFYNEKPGGPLYNYPRPLNREEIDQIVEVLLGNNYD
ncbi:MAG: radical SAM protein [Candidatus Bathyarchaeota archaeon]|nr:MAG: radical SAM protein [Candidatus Bathyarchaeota archaeon]